MPFNVIELAVHHEGAPTLSSRSSHGSSRSTQGYHTVLAGQSNMVGAASIDHLDQLVADRNCGLCRRLRRKLLRKTGYRVWNRVYVRFGDRSGPLTIDRANGYGYPNDFGPEVGIGVKLGNKTPILLIKTAWGGRDLSFDFRPPSSGPGGYPNSDRGDKEAGWQYQMMLDEIQYTLDHIGSYHPMYNGANGYELAGFVWFQGFNDYIIPKRTSEYEVNLMNFVADVRHDLDVASLPVVRGQFGVHGSAEQYSYLPIEKQKRIEIMRSAQITVANLSDWNITRVSETAKFFDDSETFDGGYHYNGRADTMYQIGRAMGSALQKIWRRYGR